jgi:hypothetical protein
MLKQLPAINDLGPPPLPWKMAEVAGHQEVGAGAIVRPGSEGGNHVDHGFLPLQYAS